MYILYVIHFTELITLLSKNVQSTTQQPVTSIDTNTQQPTTTTVTTTIPETTNQMQSCIDNFFCSKICNHGYKTNNINCPVCECMDGTPLSTLGGAFLYLHGFYLD